MCDPLPVAGVKMGAPGGGPYCVLGKGCRVVFIGPDDDTAT